MKDQIDEKRPTAEPAAAATAGDQDLSRAINPDPRANENVKGDGLEEGSAEGVGSEITDGGAS